MNRCAERWMQVVEVSLLSETPLPENTSGTSIFQLHFSPQSQTHG